MNTQKTQQPCPHFSPLPSLFLFGLSVTSATFVDHLVVSDFSLFFSSSSSCRPSALLFCSHPAHGVTFSFLLHQRSKPLCALLRARTSECTPTHPEHVPDFLSHSCLLTQRCQSKSHSGPAGSASMSAHVDMPRMLSDRLPVATHWGSQVSVSAVNLTLFDCVLTGGRFINKHTLF